MRPMLRFTLIAAAMFGATSTHAQQQQVRPPISVYGVDVATTAMSIPGMTAGGMGAMAGMPGMPAGMGGPQKELWLGLRSSQKAVGEPEAQHMIPPGMSMGPSLTLLGSAPAPVARRDTFDPERPPEKPKARMLMYWGCGDAIRPGQPKIADTEKMDMVQFGQALVGRSPPDRGSAIRNAQLRWPNERETQQVPAQASLRGDQVVRGNATPEIRFAVGERQDFMPPMEVSAQGPIVGPTPLAWTAIPTAQGYFLQAMGFRQSGNEMIIWTSSEVQDSGWGLMTYLPNDFLRKMINDRVVLPPSVSSCTIPKGVFEGVEGGMVNSIAYGEEQNLVHPPRPADPKVAWEQQWTVKLRVKSVGMTPLGMEEGMGGRRGAARGGERPPTTGSGPASMPTDEPKPSSPADDAADTMNKLRKLLPF